MWTPEPQHCWARVNTKYVHYVRSLIGGMNLKKIHQLNQSSRAWLRKQNKHHLVWEVASKHFPLVRKSWNKPLAGSVFPQKLLPCCPFPHLVRQAQCHEPQPPAAHQWNRKERRRLRPRRCCRWNPRAYPWRPAIEPVLRSLLLRHPPQSPKLPTRWPIISSQVSSIFAASPWSTETRCWYG